MPIDLHTGDHLHPSVRGTVHTERSPRVPGSSLRESLYERWASLHGTRIWRSVARFECSAHTNLGALDCWRTDYEFDLCTILAPRPPQSSREEITSQCDRSFADQFSSANPDSDPVASIRGGDGSPHNSEDRGTALQWGLAYTHHDLHTGRWTLDGCVACGFRSYSWSGSALLDYELLPVSHAACNPPGTDLKHTGDPHVCLSIAVGRRLSPVPVQL
mmetsp:Transcript_2139/g.5013  ORF Transcript_2139/g.5013 Transcript_2139/m.5013 type:complete len:217 (+) Transcript_2139:260-910(+)